VIGLRTYLGAAAAGLVVGVVGLASTVSGGTAWGWIAVISLSLGSLFALSMTLSVDVASHPGEVAAIAGMQLGVGYTMAALSPFALGALRDATGSFTAGLWVVAGIAVLVLASVAATLTLMTRNRVTIATRT
jgi:CP family cyanate transporter-like MFS transporter